MSVRLGGPCARPGLVLLLGVATLLHCRTAPLGEEIDTLDYFLSDHPETALVGDTYDAARPEAPTHPLSLTVEGQHAYYVKWHPNAYEHYAWDDEYVYLKEDRSFTDAADENRLKPHAFTDGRWLRRRMRVGEVIDSSANQIRLVYRGDCREGRTSRLGYKAVLEARLPAFDAGGEIGVQDVIVLRYDYSFRTGIPDRARVNSYEKFYYSREWGWIQWELYQDDDLGKDPPTLRKRFRCNRSTSARTPPNLENTCNRARFVEMAMEGGRIPELLTLRPGERRRLALTLQNVGGSTWRSGPGVAFRLGLVGDRLQEGHRVLLGAGEEVPPGASKTFPVPLLAPNEPGEYGFQWRMLVEGAEWFGDASPPARVRVVAR